MKYGGQVPTQTVSPSSQMWVLDTNTLIYFFKGEGAVADNLLSHAPGDIGVPAIVIFELQVGIAKSSSPEKRTAQLAELLSSVHLLPFGSTEADVAAHIRAELESAGTPIGLYDILIAGTAAAHRATLVTRNIREFSRIPKLQIEDWYS